MRNSRSLVLLLSAAMMAFSCNTEDGATSVSAIEEEPGNVEEGPGVSPGATESVDAAAGVPPAYRAYVEAEGRIPADEDEFRAAFGAMVAERDHVGTSLEEVGCSLSACFLVTIHDSGAAQMEFLQIPMGPGSPFGRERFVHPGFGNEEPITTFMMTSRGDARLPALETN